MMKAIIAKRYHADERRFLFFWKKKKSRSSCYVTIYYKLY